VFGSDHCGFLLSNPKQSISYGEDSMPKLILPDYDKAWKNRLVFAVWATAAVAGAITVINMFGIVIFGIVNPPIEQKKWAGKMLMLWVLLPPIWFWAEYWLLFRHDKNCQSPGKLEQFKFAVELSKNVWLALVVLLGALYFDIKIPGVFEAVPDGVVIDPKNKPQHPPLAKATDAVIEKPR
jgi:hypothetical protein